MHLLIFDLDGTLVDSKQDLIDAVNATRGYMNLAPLPGELVAKYVGRGALALVRSALGETAPEADVERAHTFFIRYYGEHMLDKTVLYDGVREALDRLKTRGHTLAVLTNKPVKFSDRMMDRVGY
jgi:phosphoglycolate phosphatase